MRIKSLGSLDNKICAFISESQLLATPVDCTKCTYSSMELFVTT